MVRKIIITIVGLALIAISIAWTASKIAGKDAPKKKAKPASVKYAKTKIVKYQDYPALIEATGRLRSFNKTNIFSEVQGKLILNSKKLKVGTRYSKGEIIIQVDPEQAEIDLKSAKSAFLSLISASMADIKADYPNEFENWEAFLSNYDIEKPVNDLPEVNNKQLKYFLSNRNIFKTYYDIKNLELRLSKHKITAPFNCVVISSNIDEGGLVMPGQMLATIAETGSFELELAVQEDEADLISIGSKVIAGSESEQNEWEGRVIRKAGNIDPATQTLKVFARITGKNLLDGMYLNANIYGKEIENAFQIDRSALVNAESIYYLNDSSELQLKNIDVILTNRKSAFLRGIDSNTTVIAQPLANVALGTKIKSIENEEAM